MQIKNYLLLLALFLLATNSYCQVGIGTTNPSPNAMLEVSSQTNGMGPYRGLMPPRVPDIAARDAIGVTAADAGLMVFVEDNGNGQSCLQIWVGDSWDDGKCFVINTPPVATDVTFTGDLYTGETLTSSFTYSDADGDLAGAHIYKWYRANNAGGTGSVISGATSDTYTIVAADLGKYLAVEITPVATTGISPGIPVRASNQGPVTDPPTTASDLFISEYVEGSGNNKAIEIANFTGSSVNLNGYRLALYGNGSATATAVITFNDNFVLAHGAVYVIKHSQANLITTFNQSSASLGFNGNDAVALRTSGGVVIDVVGEIGVDYDFGKDETLRKYPALGPSTTYFPADFESLPIDTFDGLGSHTY